MRVLLVTRLVDAACPGKRDPFQPTLAPQIGLEPGEHAQHVEERLASRRSGVHGLPGRAQRHAAALRRRHDVPQVFHRPGKAIDAGRDQGVTGLHEVERHLRLGSPVAAGTAAGRLEGRTPDREVLAERAGTCGAASGHFVPKGPGPRNATVRDYRRQP